MWLPFLVRSQPNVDGFRSNMGHFKAFLATERVKMPKHFGRNCFGRNNGRKSYGRTLGSAREMESAGVPNFSPPRVSNNVVRLPSFLFVSGLRLHPARMLPYMTSEQIGGGVEK